MTNMQQTRRIARIIICAVIISSCTCILQAQEKKKKFSKKDLPAAVLSAFEKEYPKAMIKGGGKEKEKGMTYYEVESVDGKVKRDLLYTPEGKKTETEETIDMSAAPASIKPTLDAEYPKCKILKAEKVMKDSSTTYEILLRDGKKSHEVVFDADGKMIKGGKNDKDEEDEEDEEDEIG